MRRRSDCEAESKVSFGQLEKVGNIIVFCNGPVIIESDPLITGPARFSVASVSCHLFRVIVRKYRNFTFCSTRISGISAMVIRVWRNNDLNPSDLVTLITIFYEKSANNFSSRIFQLISSMYHWRTVKRINGVEYANALLNAVCFHNLENDGT